MKADAGQIEQVIMNMVMNAADAMPNGGKLTLETANVTLDTGICQPVSRIKPGEYVMLAITDTGAGMSEEVKPRVFEPFFSTKGVGEGTGSGIVHLLRHHQTKRRPHQPSTANLGGARPSKFICRKWNCRRMFPHRRPVATRLCRAERKPSCWSRMIPPCVRWPPTLLGRLGYTVLTAANGVEALTLAQRAGTGHIDLLFTDVVMPHMSGKELADRVQSLVSRHQNSFHLRLH